MLIDPLPIFLLGSAVVVVQNLEMMMANKAR
jgi:hypothetical protein